MKLVYLFAFIVSTVTRERGWSWTRTKCRESPNWQCWATSGLLLHRTSVNQIIVNRQKSSTI